MLHKVVVGVDGTRSARDAVVLGRALAAADDPDMLLVGACSDPLLPFPSGLRRDLHLGRDVEQVLLEVRQQLAPDARTHVKADLSPGRALCREIAREHADLLVLGSTRKLAAGRAGAGRTGRQALHGAACAVALAAHGIHAAPFSLRCVVVGVDRSEESGAALALARAIADAAGARLTAVAVVDDRLPATVAPAGMAIELVQWDELVGAHREQTEQLLADIGERAPGLTTELRVGDPAEELAAAAESADLLVIGSRRWGPLSRLVVGSTGEELVREAPCSLLLVPRPAEEAARVGENS
ncbi:MAG TPA: universal stress protein [Conexibacter sp.]|jgi:nucleotide-binding universal stress UspA family protein|nr:universal stress protein [Conexibacter sp.]